MYQDMMDIKSRGAVSSDMKDQAVLGGSHRASVPGNQKGTVFLVGFDVNPTKPREVPKRLQGYSKGKSLSQSDIDAKLKLADERKKRHDENKARQAKKVSEESVRYDMKVNHLLAKHSTSIEGINDKSPNRKTNSYPTNRWFSSALKK